mgnify:CR=1 FL=1
MALLEVKDLRTSFFTDAGEVKAVDGVSFSLDDFGTGQSNLNYIVDMPVQIVKFDRTMINSYFENGKAKYVMDAAMHMIQGMELEIVAEGIETKEQYDTMRALDISYIQGYYFSKPIPEQEFLKFIKAKSEGNADKRKRGCRKNFNATAPFLYVCERRL